MGSQAVGFQFQGDVIGGSSLLYTATGRLLKALNHGGVDFYAVAASVQLGKLIPLTQERESAICKLLEQRRASRESYLSKALRIGWGHSDIPHELARTKAGVSALNIIGVLATGCKPFEAAKALSTLMEIHGCDADALPSLDSLSNMIDFLSPFITNSTFESVITNVRLVCISVLTKNGLVVPKATETKGDSTQWARTVKHLIATSQAVENAHIAVGQRGAWLAAYAAHILGLSVTVYYRNVILWEAVGTHGSVTMYLYDDLTALTAGLTQPLLPAVELERLEPPLSSERAPSMVHLNQVVESGITWLTTAQMTDQPYSFTFDKTLTDHILEAIIHFSKHVFDNATMKWNNWEDLGWPINGHFPKRNQALRTALQHLGITNLGRVYSQTRGRKQSGASVLPSEKAMCEHIETADPSFSRRTFPAIAHLHPEAAIRISKLCNEASMPGNPPEMCLCRKTALFIFEMSALAVALAHCSYDENVIRINENVLRNGKDYSTSQYWIDFAAQEPLEVFYDTLFVYLVRLLDLNEVDRSLDFSGLYLAWSEGGIAFYIRALFDSECFDDWGRALVITSGQISCNGLRRNLVQDRGVFSYSRARGVRVEGTFNTFDVNTEIAPLWAKGPIAHETVVNVESHATGIKFRLFDLAQRRDHDAELSMGLFDIIQHLLTDCRIIGQRCHHDPLQSYVVKRTHSPVTLHTFGDLNRSLDFNTSKTLIFALSQSPMSQLMQIVLLGDGGYCVALQRDSCLDCIINAARNHEEETTLKKAVIMT